MANVEDYEHNRIKVGAIMISPAPYRDPTYALIDNDERFQLEVLVLYDSDVNHSEWEYYNKRFNGISNWKIIKIPKLGDYHLGLLDVLRERKYDVIIISGYSVLANIAAFLYCKVTKTPYIYSADTVTNGKYYLIKKLLVSKIYRKASALWVPGEASKSYFSKKGVSEEKIFLGSYMVNSPKNNWAYYDKSGEDLLLRKGLGVRPNEFLFLFIGKLIPTRNIQTLVEAMKIVSQKSQEYKLLIIGNGGNQSLAKDIEENSRIIHIESVPLRDLQRYYDISDCYVHPGREPYSLALAQAAMSGIPIICSKEVGASWDYVHDNSNGIIIQKIEPSSLSYAMLKMKSFVVNKHNDIKRCQRRIVKEKTFQWAYEELANAIIKSRDSEF